MSDEMQRSGQGPFIPAELRPAVGADLEDAPLLAPEAGAAEIGRLAEELLGERERVRLGLEEAPPPPEFWQHCFARGPEVSATVLDGEAVLLHFDSGVYYSLNRLGTAIWELLTGEQPLEGILSTIRERYEVSEAVARGDLAVLVGRLRQEGLIEERR
jgi:hypothetical protein